MSKITIYRESERTHSSWYGVRDDVSFEGFECVQHEIDPAAMMTSIEANWARPSAASSIPKRWGLQTQKISSYKQADDCIWIPCYKLPQETSTLAKRSKTRQEQQSITECWSGRNPEEIFIAQVMFQYQVFPKVPWEK